MSAVLLDGVSLARKIRQSLFPRVAAVKTALKRAPRLAVITISQDAPSAAYVQATCRACRKSEIETEVRTLSADASLQKTIELLRALSQDPAIDAIIVDRPLPRAVEPSAVAGAVAPAKDAEGIAPENYGRLFLAKTYDELHRSRLIVPPTALAVAELIRATKMPVAGKLAVIIGRSSIVGRPAAHLLEMLNATTILCHSQTKDLQEEVGRADFLVACVGQLRLIKSSWLKKGSVVIDTGMNPEKTGFCGDVDSDGAAAIVSYLTPVPGGVGPVTTALLLANTVLLAEIHASA